MGKVPLQGFWVRGAECRDHARLFVGYHKVNYSENLSIFGDKYPQNGSKDDLMAPRTTLECPHEGPSVVSVEADSWPDACFSGSLIS